VASGRGDLNGVGGYAFGVDRRAPDNQLQVDKGMSPEQALIIRFHQTRLHITLYGHILPAASIVMTVVANCWISELGRAPHERFSGLIHKHSHSITALQPRESNHNLGKRGVVFITSALSTHAIITGEPQWQGSRDAPSTPTPCCLSLSHISF